MNLSNCKLYSYFETFKKWISNYFKSIEEREIKSRKDSISIGAGFDIDDRFNKHFKEIRLDNNNRKGHMLVFGTTGSGKSRLVEVIAEQDIMNGDSVIIIDPKLDNALLSRIYQSCVRAGCENQFMFLSTVYPEISIKINPLSNYYSPDEIINHTVASVPTSDPFFYAISLETTSAIVYSRLIEKKQYGDLEPLNLYDIYKYVSHAGLSQLKESMETIENICKPEDKKEVSEILALLTNVLSSPVEYFSKVTTTLRTTLTQLTIGAVGKVIGQGKSNEFITRLDKGERVILYVQTPSMLAKTTSDTLVKTVLSMFQSAVGRRAIDDNPFEQPVSLICDEFSNSIYMGVENLFNKSRSANVKITALTQSFADIEDAVGKEKAKMILGNTNAKMFLRLTDVDTAETVARYGGETLQYASMLATQNFVMREEKKLTIDAKEVLELKPREFFYFGFEGNFRGKIKKISGSEIKVIMPKKGYR